MKNFTQSKFTTRALAFFMSLLMIVSVIPVFAITAYADVSPDRTGWGITSEKITVYETKEFTNSNYGSLYKGEGFTVTDVNKNSSGEVYYEINYSATNYPNGKSGYIKESDKFLYSYKTAAKGTVKTSTNVYYYALGTSQRVGSVSAGETVAVLARNTGDQIVYIEYNTTSGRKRGFCSASCIDFSDLGKNFPEQFTAGDFVPGYGQIVNKFRDYYGYKRVYSGPGEAYIDIDYVDSNDNVWVFSEFWSIPNKQLWAYIAYENFDRTGYIRIL